MDEFDPKVQQFLRSYEHQYDAFKAEADRAQELVEHIIGHRGGLLHTISARAKTPKSLRGKLRRKDYSKPASEITDLIGVRVITFYHDDVHSIAGRLRNQLEINEVDSIDKRVQLGLREFGYRSVQLIARPKAEDIVSRGFQLLNDHWFEIQVRSILEHAWAEIEHEVVYKSKVEYPEEIVRRFASLAGTIELLDDEFLDLRDQRSELIDKYRIFYKKNKTDAKHFDVARLLGFLEATRPKGLSWRRAEADRTPFQPGLDTSCVDALRAVGLDRPRSLSAVFRSWKYRNAASAFAASRGIAPKEISHLASVVIALVVTDPVVVKRFFPEVVFDPVIEKMIAARIAKQR
ncbi:MAG: hypothetical protein AAF503_00350 [Pseudomonadota bacterium]